MAREATITFEQVATVADNIKAQGGKASARAVREVLGSGSMATVLKLLQQWQSGQVRQSAVIDDTLDSSVVRAISHQIATRIQEATADATARLADLQAEADAIIIENERQVVEIETQLAERAALQDQYAALVGRTQQLETDAARTAAELVTERAAAGAARVNLAKAELRLEAVPRIEAEIVQVRADLAAERAKSAEQHEAAAVAIARNEAGIEKSKGLEAQLAEANKNAQAVAAALNNEKIVVQGLQARLDSAEKLAREIKSELVIVTEEAKKSADTAAELRGRISELEAQKVKL